MPDACSTVINLISTMSTDDRKRVKAYLDSISGVSAVSEKQTDDKDEPLSLLMDFLSREGITVMPLAVLKRSRFFSSNKITTAWAWVRSQTNQKLERQSIFILGCKCLKSYLINQGVQAYTKKGKPYKFRLQSVGLHEMLNHVDLMPVAVESSFPSYAQAGLIKSVALREMH